MEAVAEEDRCSCPSEVPGVFHGRAVMVTCGDVSVLRLQGTEEARRRLVRTLGGDMAESTEGNCVNHLRRGKCEQVEVTLSVSIMFGEFINTSA